MFAPASRHAIVNAIADPAIAATLQRQLDAAFAPLAASYGLDGQGRPAAGLQFVCRTVPAGVRLVSFTPDAATVQVWSAGLIGLAGSASTRPVAEAWNTSTIRLHWVADGWRWAGFTQQDGPTPVSGLQPASGAAAIAAATSDFAELRYAG